MNQDNFNSPNDTDFDQTEFDQFDGLDNHTDASFTEDFTAPPKKKSSLVPMILILAILAGAGGAAYQFYFKPLLAAREQAVESGVPPMPTAATPADNSLPNGVSSTPNDGTMPPAVTDAAGMVPPPPAPINAVPAANDGTVPPAPAATPAAPVADAGAMDNSALPAPINPSADAAKSDPSNVEAPARMVNSNDPATPVAEATSGLMPDDDNTMIKPSLPGSAAPVMPVAVPATKAAAIAVSPITPTSTTDNGMAPVSNPVELAAATADPALTKKVNDLEMRLHDLPTAETIAQLTAKLDMMTERLDAMEKRAAESSPIAPVAKPVLPTMNDAAPLAPVDSKPAEPAAVAPKPAKKPAVKKAAVPSAAGWILRSAQPGSAWLSKSGSEEMVRYAVGQALPGSGTVTAVEQDNGTWIVKTSSGAMIRQ